MSKVKWYHLSDGLVPKESLNTNILSEELKNYNI